MLYLGLIIVSVSSLFKFLPIDVNSQSKYLFKVWFLTGLIVVLINITPIIKTFDFISFIPFIITSLLMFRYFNRVWLDV